MVALATYPNFLREMQAQGESLIQPLAALAALHNSRVGTYIRVGPEKMQAMAPDPMLCREQSLSDAVRELKKRLLGVSPIS